MQSKPDQSFQPWDEIDICHIFVSTSTPFFSILDLTVDSFPIELWESGAIYFHNHDKDGHQICKLYNKICLPMKYYTIIDLCSGGQ